jgi:hypothetical protein
MHLLRISITLQNNTNISIMLKSVFIFIFSAIFFLSGFSQKQETQIGELFWERGEVYFRFISPLDIKPETLTRLVSIDRKTTNDGFLYAYANQKQFSEFMGLEIDFEILPAPGIVPDVIMRSEVDLKQITNWDFYPTYEAYIEMMYQFQEDYPDLCEIITIGESVEGRELLAARISDNVGEDEGEPKFLYTSSMHGDELTGYVLMLRMINYLLSNYGLDGQINSQVDNLVNNLDIFINPLANPDGTYHGGNSSVNGAQRYNANYVDMNRNYPDPEDGQHPDGNEWQPETIAFMQFAEDYQFTASANFHGGAEVFNYPWDTWPQLSPEDEWWQIVGHKWADTAQFYSPPGYMVGFDDGITNGYAWYPISGGRQDYMNWFRDCLEVTVEISNVKLIPASQLPDYWEYNYHSFLNYMEEALALIGIPEEFNNNHFIVSPNPSKGLFDISYNIGTNGNSWITVSNCLGEVVSKKDLYNGQHKEGLQVDLRGLPAGVYFVGMKTGNKSFTEKIIIE